MLAVFLINSLKGYDEQVEFKFEQSNTDCAHGKFVKLYW